MGALIKRLEQAQPINDEKANKLAEWFREHQEDLLYLIKQGFQIRKIQTEAMLDLGDKYPHDVNFETALCFSLLQLEAVKKEMEQGVGRTDACVSSEEFISETACIQKSTDRFLNENIKGCVNIPVIEKVEDLERVEKEKKARKRAEKVVEPDNTEPYMVGNKKYYYVKFKINKKEVKTVKLSPNIKSVRQFLYDKKYRESQMRGYEVPFEIIDIRYAEKDELVRMGIIDAGENR